MTCIAPILSLPLEISQQAIIHLTPTDVAALSQTCKTFRNIFYADDASAQYVWASIFLDIWDDPRIRILFEQKGGWFVGTPAQMHAALAEIDYDWRAELQSRLRAKNLISSKKRAVVATCEERKAALSAFLAVVYSALPYRLDEVDIAESRNFQWVLDVLEEANALNHTMWPSLRHEIFRSTSQFPDAEEHDLRSELHTLVGLTKDDRLTTSSNLCANTNDCGTGYGEDIDLPNSMATFINHSLRYGIGLDDDWRLHEESPFHPSPVSSLFRLRSMLHPASESTSSSPLSLLRNKGRVNLRTAARSYAYDLRMYSKFNLWGPLLRDPKQLPLSDDDDYHYIARWRHLECLMMVVTFNIEEERMSMAGGTLAFLLSTPSPPMHPDSLRPWSAPGFAKQLADKIERERSLRADVLCCPSTCSDPPAMSESGWPDWNDWAGVEGRWKRIICFMDYRDLARYNNLAPQFARFPPESRDASIFEEEDFHEAVRCLNVDVRISDIDPDPPSYCKARPKISFVGHSEYLVGEDTSRQMRGSVECMPSGVIRWNLVSIWDGEERWTSQGVQIGGVGSARGVIGSWSGFEHNPGDPVGPFWFWKIAGREVLKPMPSVIRCI
ncbi:hypothetical protein FRB95_004090 [Tulasnella sp. JGI-2019a]|nr:hypothetical protein FRB95_004090 [Tulasnella sp. JGI-2019a]